MISFLKGNPGDGKSMWLVYLVVKSLLKTDAFVVTNEELKLPELRAYLCEQGWEGDLDERLRVIAKEDVFEFYRFRSGGLVLPQSPDMTESHATKRLDRQEFLRVMDANFLKLREDVKFQRPCHYFISETQDFFGAREWQTNGRSTLYYATKHRHLRDELVFTAHQLEYIEKQLRNLATETWVVTNQMRRNVSVFKMRPCFKLRGYYGVPAPQQSPFTVQKYFLDVGGVASCYRTTGALGVHNEPEEIRNKGILPWWMMIVTGAAAIIAVIFCVTILPMMGGKAAEKMLVGSVGAKVAKGFGAPAMEPRKGPNELRSQNLEDPRGSIQSRTAQANAFAAPVQSLEQKPVYVAGVIRDRTRCTVRLTDGTMYTEEDAAIFVRRSSVEINGHSYPMAAISPGAPARRGADGNTVVVTAPGPAKVVSSPAESERATPASTANETPPSESTWAPEGSSPSPTQQKFGSNEPGASLTGPRVWTDGRPMSRRATQKR